MMLMAGLAFGAADTPSVFDMTLDELLSLKVTVASRRDEIVREAPAVMTIVTRAEIEALGARNLMDIINRLPSMQVVGHAGFYGNKTQIRAQPNSSQDRHTLILLNGRPVRENINGGNNAYFYLGFPISAIESIEIIRGPGSVLYGSNAFAAVINIKTRSTAPDTTHYEAGATYGTYDTHDYNVLITGRTQNHVGCIAAARLSRSEGPRIEWTDNTGKRDAIHYSDDADAVYFRLDNHACSLQAAYHRYTPGDFGTLGIFNNAIYISEVETFFADAGLTHQFTDSLRANLNLTLNTFTWDGSNDGITFFERRNSQNLILEPMLNYAPLEDLNLVLGGTVEYDKFGGRELFETSRMIHSVYVQSDYQFAGWIKPLIGLQFNKTEHVEGNYSPRFGLVLTPGDHWGVKLLYSEAFRRAFAAEGYLDSAFLLGNPDLEPEIIETYEAQLSYQNHTFQIDLTYFNSRQTIIEVDFTERPLRFINHSGNVATEGLELTGRVKLGKHWHALGSAIVQATDNNTAEPLMYPNYPDYMLKGGLMGKYGTTDIGLFNSYLSEGSLWHDRSNNLQANVSVDISRLLRRPDEQVRVAIYADNLLDEMQFQKPSDVGENEPIPHSYGRRLYATLNVKW
jgi:outer membrane receptor protein involved in Fe transport